MAMDYRFNCDCKGTADYCNNTLVIFYFPNLKNVFLKYDFLNNLTFMARRGGNQISVDLNCSKIPKLIEELQSAYQKYQEVQKELKKQGKLESSVQDNKANLSA